MRVAPAIIVALGTTLFADTPWNGPAMELPVTEGHDLLFDHLPLGVDPSHRRITGIAQDDLGFLWIGTDDGLKRYDGYRIRDYRHDPKDPNSLPDSYIVSLFKDRSGKLWVASGRYLDVYDPATEKFTPVCAGPASRDRLYVRVGEITEDRTGTIWLSTDKGLYEVDPAEGVRFVYQHDANRVDSLSSNVVRSSVETRDGSFWVVTTGGVDSIDRKNRKVARRAAFDMTHSVWSRVIEDHAGVLWFVYGGVQGPCLATVDRTTTALKHYRLIPKGEKISAGAKTIYEDADGNLWIATSQGGLFRLDRDRTRFVRYRNNPVNPKTIASDELTALFEDREGGMWVGTLGDGLDRFTRKPLPFRRYVHEPGNPDSLEKDSVTAVFQDGRGFLWIGFVRSLVKVDPHTGKFRFFRSAGIPRPGELSNTRIASIAEDASGDLWFGTQGDGLNRLDHRTGRFQVFRPDKNNPASLSNDIVQSLHVDRAGVLWAGTDDGLNAFDPETKSFHVYQPPVKPSRYRWISEDSRGGLWLSSAWSGVHRFDPASGKFTVYRHSNAPGTLNSDAVNAVCVAQSGIIWVGTQTGLNELDPSTGIFTVYNPGPSTISVDSILEDSRGDLWLGTEDGLVRYDPRAKTFRYYYTSDGLAANELGFSAAWKSPRGEMYFGSYGGLTVFDPSKIGEESYVPPVRLTDIQILNKPVAIGAESPLRQSISMTNSLRLRHSQSTFSLEFGALSYANPARNRYRYRLEPIEEEWNEVDSSRRSLNYTALASGNYVVRVLGSNSRGVWNQAGVRLAISVLPPWWASWWFRTLLAAMVLLSGWAFLQLRLRRQAYEFSMRLEERVEERTRIARELHDTLLQSFQASLFLFQAARNLFPRRPEEALKTLDSAITSAENALVEGRDAIQNLRAGTAQSRLEDLLRAACEELRDSGDGNPPSPAFQVSLEGRPRRLSILLQDEIYRIAREVLRNAFHHACASRIEVFIQYDPGLFRLRIRDNGKGIDRQVLREGTRPGHFGLPGIRERAKRIGAQLRVWSESGAGTEVELTVSASVAYGASNVRRRLGSFGPRPRL